MRIERGLDRVAAGVASLRAAVGLRPRRISFADVACVAEALAYSCAPERHTPGNRLQLLVNGDQAFPAMLEAVEGARSFVHLETYILADDEVGREFARALCGRARAGVSVRVLFDSFGSLRLPFDYVRRLTEAGVEAVEFRPVTKHWFSLRGYRRDHRKVLVVDGTVGFTGGLNVSSEYASLGSGGAGWRDTHLRAQGPVVAELEALFRASWQRSGGTPYLSRPRSTRGKTADSAESVLAAVVASDGGHRSVIRRHYLHAILAARKTIFIANAYFVPDRGLIRAMKRAAARGVRVSILVPRVSDVPLVQWATEHLFDRLLRHGIEVYLWPETHMHAKTAVIDGTWSVVGSYNLDSVSLVQNHEVVIESIGAGFGAWMNEQFERDRRKCHRVRLAEWRRRPLWRRPLEGLAYRMRRWL